MSAAEIAKALGGHPTGDGYLCRCPVPTHGKGRGDRNPSLFVKDGYTGKPVVSCFGACSSSDVLAELRRVGLDDQPDEIRRSGARDIRRGSSDVRPIDENRRLEPDPHAIALWRAAAPIADTLAERYLIEHRKLRGPFPPTLRFAHAPYRPVGRNVPALATAVQAADRRVIAVQATFLNLATAAKANVSVPRWTFGKLGAGAVRLAAAGPVLGIAEGTETALAAMQLSGLPCWAVLGSERLATVWLPPEAVEVHIFADNDEAGRRGADRAAERLSRAGRRVLIRSPAEEYGDWADVVADLAREDAA